MMIMTTITMIIIIIIIMRYMYACLYVDDSMWDNGYRKQHSESAMIRKHAQVVWCYNSPNFVFYTSTASHKRRLGTAVRGRHSWTSGRSPRFTKSTLKFVILSSEVLQNGLGARRWLHLRYAAVRVELWKRVKWNCELAETLNDVNLQIGVVTVSTARSI
jgi:hypothetical protein